MDEDYLWDCKGEPDPQVARLEELLAPFRYQPRPLATSLRKRRLLWIAPIAAAAIAAPLCLSFGFWRLRWTADNPWPVQVLAGTPSIAGAPIMRNGLLGVGQVLRTDSTSRAALRVAHIGRLEVGPNTKLKLVATRSRHHRLALEEGILSARVWAPPWTLSLETPEGMAFDLGCAFTLEAAPNGVGSLRVTSGWVQLQGEGVQSLVPAGARALTRKGFAPGTPFFEDAAPDFKMALEALNFGSAPESALQTLLTQSRSKDAITLLSLFLRSSPERRGAIFDRAAQLLPPPAGVTREGVVQGNQLMLDTWWDAQPLPRAKTWWIHWKDGIFF